MALSFIVANCRVCSHLRTKRLPQSIRVYDRHGILLYEHYVDHRSIAVAYNDIPQVMRNAMVAAEDPTFWQNTGVDPQGILRAAVGLVSHSGTIQSGGVRLRSKW